MVTGTRLVGRRSRPAREPLPLDGTDPEPPPDPLPLDAGVRVSVEASLPPDCDVPAGTPVFVVTSRPEHGQSRHDRCAISNTREFQRLAKEVCRLGPRLRITGSTTRPDGSFTIRLAVTNPGEPARLVSRKWTNGGTHWQAAAIDVPGGDNATVELPRHRQGCSHEGPWEHGQVTLDGVVLAPPAQGHGDPC
jgi:hypothetical protein